MKLTLMFRPYCGLCHQMHDALQPYLTEFNATLEIVEIDDFPELEARYNELVPVLLHGEHEICHWHLDESALRDYLMQAACTPTSM